MHEKPPLEKPSSISPSAPSEGSQPQAEKPRAETLGQLGIQVDGTVIDTKGRSGKVLRMWSDADHPGGMVKFEVTDPKGYVKIVDVPFAHILEQQYTIASVEKPVRPSRKKAETSPETELVDPVNPETLQKLFGSKENLNLEIKEAEAESKAFQLRYVLTPTEWEMYYLPSNTAFEVTIQGKQDAREPDRIVITDMSIDAGIGQITLSNLVPGENKLIVDPESPDNYQEDKKEIILSRLASFDDLVTLFHEAGHAQDHALHPTEKGEIPLGNALGFDSKTSGLPPHEIGNLIRLGQQRERAAWLHAHRLVRQHNLPIQKLIKIDSAMSLASYDQIAAERLAHIALPGDFASSEQRHSMRSPERQAELQKMNSVGLRARELKQTIVDSIGKPLVNALKNREGKFSFVFPDRENQRLYSIELTGLEESLVIGEGSLTGENNINTTLYVDGFQRGSIREFEVGGQPLDMEGKVTFAGELSVLRRDQPSNTHEVYNKMMRIFNNLSQPSVHEALVIAAFRREYAEAPEPPELNPESGKRLTLQEKLIFMQDKTPSYKLTNIFNKSLNQLKTDRTADQITK